jgi:hypothetical protein
VEFVIHQAGDNISVVYLPFPVNDYNITFFNNRGKAVTMTDVALDVFRGRSADSTVDIFYWLSWRASMEGEGGIDKRIN